MQLGRVDLQPPPHPGLDRLSGVFLRDGHTLTKLPRPCTVGWPQPEHQNAGNTLQNDGEEIPFIYYSPLREIKNKIERITKGGEMSFRLKAAAADGHDSSKPECVTSNRKGEHPGGLPKVRCLTQEDRRNSPLIWCKCHGALCVREWACSSMDTRWLETKAPHSLSTR